MVCGQRLWTYGAFAPVTVTYAKPGRFRLPIRPTASSPVLLKFTGGNVVQGSASASITQAY